VLGVAMVAEGWAAPLTMVPFDPRGRPDDRAAYRWLAQQPPGAAIELPISEWSIAPTLTYQYATLSHGHPIVNGYSGYNTPLQEFLGGGASPLNDLDRIEEALDMLRALGVSYVLVHPKDFADPAVGVNTVAAIAARSSVVSDTFRSGDVVGFRLLDSETVVVGGSTLADGARVPASAFRARASDATERLPRLFDGDGDTRWLTGRPQNGDEWLALDFEQARDVSAIELVTAPRSFGDYPRALRIESTDEAGKTSVLFEGPMLLPYARALAAGRPQPAIVVNLPANRTRTLTIRQTATTRRWFWAVHELLVYQRKNR
jgi:hypothetical protein